MTTSIAGCRAFDTRMLLDRLNERSGQTLTELCACLDMARQSVSKHLAVLEAANLVTTVWRGREKLHYLNAEPINAIADRWISRYDRGRPFTPELAETIGFDGEFFARLAKEPRSKVTFDIEETDAGVKLTVVHDRLQPGGAVLQAISGGWPVVLSKLKTMLETEHAEISNSAAR